MSLTPIPENPLAGAESLDPALVEKEEFLAEDCLTAGGHFILLATPLLGATAHVRFRELGLSILLTLRRRFTRRGNHLAGDKRWKVFQARLYAGHAFTQVYDVPA